MRFDILTLFPSLFDGIFQESIVKRALEDERIAIDIHDIRDYAPGKHRVTDDAPYGGGGGMVMKPEPIANALEDLVDRELLLRQKQRDTVEIPIVLLAPTGRRFDQETAQRYERHGHIVLICGRYEGVDERINMLYATEEVSLGDFVLSGGEIPAMAIVEAVTRLVPGVLGDMRAIVEDSYASGLLEHPHFTRPREFRGLAVPEVLLSGDHAKVAEWRRQQALQRTLERRPDLLERAKLSQHDREYLQHLLESRDDISDSEN